MSDFYITIAGFDLPWLSNQSLANTLILLIITVIGRLLLMRIIRGNGERMSDTRRRWMSVVQNTTILFLILGFIFIWSPQLSTFALSLTAFAVALVVATKEYILCMVGAIYRATSNPFSVGDWIEIQGLRGEVLTEGILTTKLQELGIGSSKFDFTGRVLTIPNSVLLTQTVFNEDFRKYYLHHKFKVTVDAGIDPAKITKGVLPLLQSHIVDSEALSQKKWNKLSQKTLTPLPTREPRLAVETTDIGKISFIITIFCAVDQASMIEAAVTEKILRGVVDMSETPSEDEG